MTRRALLFATAAAGLRADSADDVWDVLAGMASALTRGEPADFLGAIDRAMPGYERLRASLIALARDYQVETAIDLVSNEGNDRARTVEADWLLRLTPLQYAAETVRRRERVVVKMEKQGKRWKVVSLDPLAVLDPPRV